MTANENWDRGRLSHPSSEGHGGGVVIADNSNFIINRKYADFLQYTFSNTIRGFVGNNFICKSH